MSWGVASALGKGLAQFGSGRSEARFCRSTGSTARQAIRELLSGNAGAGKHVADADHVWDACKYGGYFITHDKRILERAGAARPLLPPSLQIMTLGEFLDVYDAAERGAVSQALSWPPR